METSWCLEEFYFGFVLLSEESFPEGSFASLSKETHGCKLWPAKQNSFFFLNELDIFLCVIE